MSVFIGYDNIIVLKPRRSGCLAPFARCTCLRGYVKIKDKPEAGLEDGLFAEIVFAQGGTMLLMSFI